MQRPHPAVRSCDWHRNRASTRAATWRKGLPQRPVTKDKGPRWRTGQWGGLLGGELCCHRHTHGTRRFYPGGCGLCNESASRGQRKAVPLAGSGGQQQDEEQQGRQTTTRSLHRSGSTSGYQEFGGGGKITPLRRARGAAGLGQPLRRAVPATGGRVPVGAATFGVFYSS